MSDELICTIDGEVQLLQQNPWSSSSQYKKRTLTSELSDCAGPFCFKTAALEFSKNETFGVWFVEAGDWRKPFPMTLHVKRTAFNVKLSRLNLFLRGAIGIRHAGAKQGVIGARGEMRQNSFRFGV